MGLLDQIIRSAVGSATTPATRGGSSPIVMALLALLASKVMAGRTTVDSAPGGSVGGLGGLIESFQRGGFEDVIQSWIGTGPNNAISPDQLHQALGAAQWRTSPRRRVCQSRICSLSSRSSYPASSIS
jgi:uncharacterized protein YidB (DUF937 family)